MNRSFLFLVLLTGAAAVEFTRAEEDSPVTALQDSFARVAEGAEPAVVSIATEHLETGGASPEFYFGDPFEDFFHDFYGQSPRRRRPRPRRVEGMGSGVIIDPAGLILTNEHVIGGAERIRVTRMGPEGRTYAGRVVGKDSRTDLAVIRIEAEEPLPTVPLGDSSRVRVGDWAVAVGSPFGLEHTVTVGVISGVRQSLDIEGRHYGDLLQTDAAINRGNSGGPLLNIRGEVIGVNTAIYAPTGVFAGIGFAIPINRAKDIIAELIEKGRVVRGWMGVEIIPLDEVLAKQFDVPDKKGAVVNQVLPDSPAQKAGIRRGDVLREFDGKAIDSQERLIDVVARTPPRKKVPVLVWRNGKPLTLALVTEERPDAPPSQGADSSGRLETDSDRPQWEGADLSPVSPGLARRYGLPPDAEGVVVTKTDSGSLAERLGLAEGDLIASVNRRPTPDPKAFLSAIRAVDVADGVLLDVNRAGKWIYLSYKDEE
jgi:serine protease Do